MRLLPVRQVLPFPPGRGSLTHILLLIRRSSVRQESVMNPPEQTPGLPPPAAPPRPRRGVGYVPTVGPRLRVVLMVIFVGVALLGATGAYLLAITALNATTTEK